MRIAEWFWDDENVEHIARHGLVPSVIEDVFANDPKFRRNKKGCAATHQMIGPDAGGRFVAAFLAPAPGAGDVWRVVTARAATAQEKEWWDKS